MLSTRYKCIFIRISKVASTSVQGAFTTPHSRWDKLMFRLFERGEFHVQHHDLEHYKKAYPDKFDSYYKFSFVRNPWDRMYSQYRYQRYNLKRPEAECLFEDWLKKCEEYYERENDFLFGRNRYYFIRHITNQADWLSIDGQVSMDFIGKYENLHEDFAKLCIQQHWNIHLPRLNETKADKDNYRSHYSHFGQELILKWHEKDVRQFGYNF